MSVLSRGRQHTQLEPHNGLMCVTSKTCVKPMQKDVILLSIVPYVLILRMKGTNYVISNE